MDEFIAFTHDNGGQPFRVHASTQGGRLRVYVRLEQSDDNSVDDSSVGPDVGPDVDNEGGSVLVTVEEVIPSRDRNSEIYEDDQFHETPAYDAGPIVRAWAGEDPRRRGVADSDTWGNAVLAHLGGTRYVMVGATVSEFDIPDGEAITEFASPIYGSDVSYPYAYSANYVYIISEGAEVTAVPRSEIDASLEDPWDLLEDPSVTTTTLPLTERVPRQ